ncbi:hypothetical protein PsalMR5_04426 (plasmid) [Piscirickettsia salmonis]|nr:hypothetical protein PsalBI1_04524 [Piscirickettsia salmonis]QGP66501.1 hypothetical protein PsalMR5_04426 [Piscirickettsia salmonis]
MLSRQQNAKAALRFFKKAIAQPYVKSPRVVNVDKHASFPPAHQKAKDEGVFSRRCKLRRVKYLNNGTVAKSYREFQKGYFLVLATLELSS